MIDEWLPGSCGRIVSGDSATRMGQLDRFYRRARLGDQAVITGFVCRFDLTIQIGQSLGGQLSPEASDWRWRNRGPANGSPQGIFSIIFDGEGFIIGRWLHTARTAVRHDHLIFASQAPPLAVLRCSRKGAMWRGARGWLCPAASAEF